MPAETRSPVPIFAMTVAAIAVLAVVGAVTGFYLGQRYRPRRVQIVQQPPPSSTEPPVSSPAVSPPAARPTPAPKPAAPKLSASKPPVKRTLHPASPSRVAAA